MPEGVKNLRDAIGGQAGKQLGRDVKQPRKFSAQMTSAEFFNDIMSLPVDLSEWGAMQDPETGEPYFVADISRVDGGDPIQ